MVTYTWVRGSGQTVAVSSAGEFISVGGYGWRQVEEWLEAGNEILPELPEYEPGSPAHYAALRDATWAHMRAFIRARHYDSIESCCSYTTSSITRYRDEAVAMVAWRDAVNVRLEELQADPPAGVVSWEDLLPHLPSPDGFGFPPPVTHNLPSGSENDPADLPAN